MEQLYSLFRNFTFGERKKNLRFSSGFTLVELALTIAIGGILTALAIPKMGKMIDGMRLRSSVTRLTDSIYLARGRAVANPNIHCGIFLETSTASHKVIVFFDDNANYFYDDGNDRVYQTAYEFENKISISTTGTTITDNAVIFRGDGSAKNGGKIRVKNSHNKYIEIDILASTGRVRTIK